MKRRKNEKMYTDSLCGRWNRIRQGWKIKWSGILLAAVILTGLFTGVFMSGMSVTARAAFRGAGGARAAAAAREGEETGTEDSLSIEVVEELSIDDEIIIEDEEVPLAMFSDAPADAGPRHAAMMGAVLLCVIGHTIYFDRREKKLFELRREAARAQKQAENR